MSLSKLFGGLSLAVLILSFPYYINRVKEADAVRAKVNTIASKAEEAAETGNYSTAHLQEEIKELNSTPYGHSVFNGLSNNLLKLEDLSPKNQEDKAITFLNDASRDAGTRRSVETLKLLGIAVLSGACAGVLLLAPMLGGFIVNKLLGMERGEGVLARFAGRLRKFITRNGNPPGMRRLSTAEIALIQGNRPGQEFRRRGVFDID